MARYGEPSPVRYAKASSMRQLLRSTAYAFVFGLSFLVAWLDPIVLPRPVIAQEMAGQSIALASNAIERISTYDPLLQSKSNLQRSAIAWAIGTVGSLSVIFALVGIFRSQRNRGARIDRQLAATRDTVSFIETATNAGLWRMQGEDQPIRMTYDCRELLNLWEAPQLITLDVLSRRIHADDRAAFLRDVRGCARFRQPLHAEYRVVADEGRIRWVAVKGRRCNEEGIDRGMIEGIFIDITAMKEMEQEVDAQREDVRHLMRQAVMNELSGSIAHELNQPLTAILSNAEAARRLLTGESVDQSKLQDIVSDIIAEAMRTADIVRRVRQMLKKGHANIESIDIVEVLESTAALLRGELARRRSSIEFSVSGVASRVGGDAVALQQVFINLIMNALDAMAQTAFANRIVKIDIAMVNDGLTVRIKDNGHGIPADVQGKLFEQFVTTKERGLGLGLWICRSILSAHGGDIEVVNNEEGGAAAIVTLRTRQANKLNQQKLMEAAE